MPRSKKIIVDLDIITVAKWDKSVEGTVARRFTNRIKKGEFHVSTPYVIFDLINEWKHTSLVKNIKEFYELYSSDIISVENLEEKIIQSNLNRKALVSDLKSFVIKEEDVILAIICSLFNLDFLVTFNRKHLKNKEAEINEVLHRYKLKKICIALPNEI